MKAREMIVTVLANKEVVWYRKGGAPMPTHLWQPMRAASQAASYINLANPGTNNLTAPGNAPTWDATNGWKFAVASTQYLDTGIVPASASSTWIARFSNRGSDPFCILGFYKSATTHVNLSAKATQVIYANGGSQAPAGGMDSGVLAVAGNQGYRNGVADGSALAAWSGTAPATSVLIGARRREDTSAIDQYGTGYVQALVRYSVILTPAQVLAVSNAMAALTP